MLDLHERRLRAKSFKFDTKANTLASWEKPKSTSPVLTAASGNANLEARLRSEGIEPAQREKSWWESGLEHLARPGAAIRGAIDAGRNKRDVLAGASQGFNAPTSVPSGQDFLFDVAKAKVPVVSRVASQLTKTGLGRFVGGAAVDIATDPLTYVGVGPAARAAGTGAAIGRKLQLAGRAVGPDLTPISKGLSNAANRIEPVRNLRDQLGIAFNPRQISQSVQGPARERIGSAIDEVARTERYIPSVESRAVKSGTFQFRGTDKSFAEAAPSYIESLPKTKKFSFIGQIGKIRAGTAPAEVKDAAELFTRSANDDLIRLKNATGMNITQLDNYVTHRYSDPPPFVREQIEGWRKGHIVLAGGTPPSSRARAIPSLAEAKLLGLHPIEDIRVLAATHKAEIDKAIALHQMATTLKSLGPDVIDSRVRAGWQPVVEIPALKGYFAHPDVARKLRDLSPMLTGAPEGSALFGNIFGAATSAFKSFALATGGFHMRNFMGNLWLNQADGLWNPKRYVQSAAGLSGKLPQIELNGTVHKWDDIWRAFEEAGLPGQGIFHEASGPRGYVAAARREVGKMDMSLAQRAAQKVLPTASRPFAPLQAGFQASRLVGERTDTFARMASFLHHLDLGEDFATASQSVRKALFDYGNLTAFERTKLKPLFPFYAWTRNNLPRQLELMGTRPGMASGTEHIRTNAVEATGTDETNVPTWLKESGAIPLGGIGDALLGDKANAQNPVYATMNLPLYDLQFIHDPADIQAWAKSTAMLTNPFVSLPFSLATNKQLYSGLDITQTPDLTDEAMGDYLNYIKAQLGGGIGRATVQAEHEAEADRLRSVKEQRGQQTMEPTPRVAGGTFLPVNVQDYSKQAQGAIYDRQRLLDQQQKSIEGKTGEALPSLEEIERKRNFPPDAPFRFRTDLEKAPQTIPAQGAPGQSFRFTTETPKVDAGEASAVVQNAVRMAGVPREWEPYMQLLMKKESGGNPTAYNPTGVVYYNARPDELYHAQGLFQMMQPTFDKYAKIAAQKNPQAFAQGFNVWDPVQNTLAAIEYIRSRYQHPSRIPGLTGGAYPGY